MDRDLNKIEEIKSMLKVLPNDAGAISEEDLEEIFKND